MEPSSGGMGSMLNRARTMLIMMVYCSAQSRRELGLMKPGGALKKMVRSIALAVMARVILVSGPAKATHIISLSGFRKNAGSTGTGLAQPRIKPEPDSIKSAGSIIDPKISICGIGFRVSLPRFLAVGSPKR